MKCEICQRDYNGHIGLSSHISKIHQIKIKEYYDQFLKKENEGICYCGKNTSFLGIRGIQKYCSSKCSNSSIEKQNLTKYNYKEKTGYEYSFQNPEVKKKIKEKNLELFGVINPQKSQLIQEKTKLTNQERYGGPAPMCSKEVQEKTKLTNQERYGGSVPMYSREIQEKGKMKCLENFGFDNYSKTPQFRQLAREQMISSIMKNYPEGSQWCPKKGNFEREVFDELQKHCNYQLLENQHIIGYFPDRYIQETKTILELYEPWHKRECYIKHDIQRQKDLEALGYKLFIIWLEDWNDNKNLAIEQFQLLLKEFIV